MRVSQIFQVDVTREACVRCCVLVMVYSCVRVSRSACRRVLPVSRVCARVCAAGRGVGRSEFDLTRSDAGGCPCRVAGSIGYAPRARPAQVTGTSAAPSGPEDMWRGGGRSLRSWRVCRAARSHRTSYGTNLRLRSAVGCKPREAVLYPDSRTVYGLRYGARRYTAVSII